MLLILIVLFIVLPIVEVWLIIQLAHVTSWTTTILIVLGTGAIGAIMVRRQGFKIWLKIQEALKRGELPGDYLLDGLLLLIGGLLLITPGLMTDTIGFLLLVPFMRSLVRILLKKWLKRSRLQGSGHFTFYSVASPPDAENEIIDVDWEEEPPPPRQIPKNPHPNE
jgi:UPF0716 protein FxsA